MALLHETDILSGDNQKPNTGQSLTEKTVKSSAWIYSRTYVTGVINLGAMAILARQLRPVDFGLVALAHVLLRFMVALGTGGIGDYVIYDRKEGREGRVHTAFWLNTLFAVCVAVFGLAILPFVTRLYTEPKLAQLIPVLILTYVFQQLVIVPDALIKRSLDLKKLVIRDTVLEILTSIASVILAILGWGIWSLVVPALVAAPIRFVAVMYMASWFPSFRASTGEWRKISRYSISVVGTNFAVTIAAEGDSLIIGKSLGIEALGIYNLAWQTANLVGRNVTGVVGKLAMPALSAVAHDVKRLRSAFNRMLRLLAVTSAPLLIGLFVVADIFVLTIYGPQWSASILPLRILIIFAIRQTIGSPASVIYNVVGKPEVALKLSLGLIPFYIASIWLGSFYGIVGVATGVTVVRTVAGIVSFYLAARLVGESLAELLHEIVQPLMAASAMGIILLVARISLEHLTVPQIPLLVALIILGGISYTLLLLTIYRNLLDDLLVVVGSLSRPVGGQLRRLARYA